MALPQFEGRSLKKTGTRKVVLKYITAASVAMYMYMNVGELS